MGKTKTKTASAKGNRSPEESMLTHADGCPENPERIEWYVQTRPDGTEVRITRCCDCSKGVVVEV